MQKNCGLFIVITLAISFLSLNLASGEDQKLIYYPKNFGLAMNSDVETQSFIEQLTKYATSEPFRAELYYYLGKAYASQGWTDKAAQYMNQWLKMSNDGIVIKDNYAFLLDEKRDKVLAVDINEKKVVKEIDVDWLPKKLIPSADETKIYVTNSLANNVSVINTSSLSTEKAIKTGVMPWNGKSSPKGDKVYIANLESNDISVINASNDNKIKNIKAGNGPWSIAVSPDGHRLYVSNQDSHEIRTIDTGNYGIVNIIGVGTHPRDISLAPDDQNNLYISNSNISNGELEIYVVDLENSRIMGNMGVANISDPFLAKFQNISLEDKIKLVCSYVSSGGKIQKKLPIPRNEAIGKLASEDKGIQIRPVNITNKSIGNGTIQPNIKPLGNEYVKIPPNSIILDTKPTMENEKGVLRIIVVVKNDTMWKISMDNYGIATNGIYKAIQEINPGIKNLNMIYAGQEMKLPVIDLPKTEIAENTPGGKIIVVKPNDSLSRIMLEYYGKANEKLCAMILNANPHIKDKNLIKWGQRLRLPHIDYPDHGNNVEKIASAH